MRPRGWVGAVTYRGGGLGGSNAPPLPEIPTALQNRAKLKKTVKKLLNLKRQHPKMFGKKAVKF